MPLFASVAIIALIPRGMCVASCSAISCRDGVAGVGDIFGRTVSSNDGSICGIACVGSELLLWLLGRSPPNAIPGVAHGGLGLDGCSSMVDSFKLLTPALPAASFGFGLTV